MVRVRNAVVGRQGLYCGAVPGRNAGKRVTTLHRVAAAGLPGSRLLGASLGRRGGAGAASHLTGYVRKVRRDKSPDIPGIVIQSTVPDLPAVHIPFRDNEIISPGFRYNADMVPGSRVVTHAIVLPVIATGVPQAGAVCVILRPDTLFHGQFNEFLHPAFRPGILGNSGQDICGAHCSGAICVMGLYPVATGQRGVAVIGCQDFQVFFASLRPAFPCSDNVCYFLAQFLFCHLRVTSCLLAA